MRDSSDDDNEEENEEKGFSQKVIIISNKNVDEHKSESEFLNSSSSN
jgi:hypothetical protein